MRTERTHRHPVVCFATRFLCSHLPKGVLVRGRHASTCRGIVWSVHGFHRSGRRTPCLDPCHLQKNIFPFLYDSETSLKGGTAYHGLPSSSILPSDSQPQSPGRIHLASHSRLMDTLTKPHWLPARMRAIVYPSFFEFGPSGLEGL